MPIENEEIFSNENQFNKKLTFPIHFKLSYVLPKCVFYREDGSCKRCDSPFEFLEIIKEHIESFGLQIDEDDFDSVGKKRYGCNEMWCEKKIDYEEKKIIGVNEKWAIELNGQ